MNDREEWRERVRDIRATVMMMINHSVSYTEFSHGCGVESPAGGFQYLFRESRVSINTEEFLYNKIVCGWQYIYINIYERH